MLGLSNNKKKKRKIKCRLSGRPVSSRASSTLHALPMHVKADMCMPRQKRCQNFICSLTKRQIGAYSAKWGLIVSKEPTYPGHLQSVSACPFLLNHVPWSLYQRCWCRPSSVLFICSPDPEVGDKGERQSLDSLVWHRYFLWLPLPHQAVGHIKSMRAVKFVPLSANALQTIVPWKSPILTLRVWYLKRCHLVQMFCFYLVALAWKTAKVNTYPYLNSGAFLLSFTCPIIEWLVPGEF